MRGIPAPRHITLTRARARTPHTSAERTTGVTRVQVGSATLACSERPSAVFMSAPFDPTAFARMYAPIPRIAFPFAGHQRGKQPALFALFLIRIGPTWTV